MEKENQPLTFLPPAGQLALPSADYYEPGGRGEHHLRDYWHILLKRKWWIISFFVVTVVSAYLITMSMTPIYQASATLRLTLENKGTMVGTLDPFYPLFHDEERTIETQFNILKSRALARRVIKLMHLEDHPEFARPPQKEGAPPVSAEEREGNLVDAFLGKLSTTRVRKTDLIRISFNSTDKDLAQKVANFMAEEYMQFEIDCKNQSFAQIKKWLENQLVQLGT